MNIPNSLAPIMALCLSPFGTTAAFHSSDMPCGTQPEHPTSGVVHLKVRTFPEPCAAECTLIIPDGLRGNTRAMLLDGAYRIVRDRPLGFSEIAGNRVDLQMNGLEPGTYTLRIWDEYGDSGATIIEHQ